VDTITEEFRNPGALPEHQDFEQAGEEPPATPPNTEITRSATVTSEPDSGFSGYSSDNSER